MPITKMWLDNQIFYVREEGDITRDDALRYSKQLTALFKDTDKPIIIVVDAMGVKDISMDARKIFARITNDPMHEKAFVASNSVPMKQASRVIGMMSEDNKTIIFESFEEAKEQAQQRQLELYGEYKA